jgi:repressor LexA
MSGLGELTTRQRQVFDFVQARLEETGSTPTLEEICSHFRFKSTNAAREHLRLIEQKGYLERRPHCARGIRVTRGKTSLDEIVRVPLIGRIAAGKPVQAFEEVEFEIPLPRAFWRGDNLFALRVRGDSMVGAGIFDGDIAIVNAQPEAANGEIAAVIIGEDTTLKRIFRSKAGVRLRAENPKYQDVVFERAAANAARVAGVLVGILRSF